MSAWDLTGFFGASIAALCALGAAKGPRLVHTERSGVNAFFVRDDLPGEYPSPETIMRRRPNLFLLAGGHRPDPHGRRYLDLDTAQGSDDL